MPCTRKPASGSFHGGDAALGSTPSFLDAFPGPSLSCGGVDGAVSPFSSWSRRALAAVVCSALALAITASWCCAPERARAAVVRDAQDPAPLWSRPVAGAVTRPFREPPGPYGAGHRGVDFVAASGTEVRASGDGTVSFAGDVAGSLHVVVTHDGGLRTSYSFLSSVAVRAGQRVTRGQVLGQAGGSGDEHGPGVVHFGLRIGERYVDPMVLFRPRDLTALVRLVPADPPSGASWETRQRERRPSRPRALLRAPARPRSGSRSVPGRRRR